MTDEMASKLIVFASLRKEGKSRKKNSSLLKCPFLVNVVVLMPEEDKSSPIIHRKQEKRPMSEENSDLQLVSDTESGFPTVIDPDKRTTESEMRTDPQGLMWSMTGVRQLFKDYRMWPTFVGPKFLQHGVPRINLPVLLWKEQASFLQENVPQAEDGTDEAVQHKSSPAKRKATLGDRSDEAADKRARTLTPSPSASEEEQTRNLIFKDLHNRKYFVGPADAYGGDYSLYKGGGDPTQTHSIATVRVIEKGHKITARELLAFSRVQNQVAKSAVLAFRLPVQAEKGLVSGSSEGEENLGGEDGEQSREHDEGATQEEQVGYIMINFRNVSDRV